MNGSNPLRAGIEQVIAARSSDLGNGFIVQRALPSAARRMVGPFVFLDQMGPALLPSGEGLDVAPHPHIGLATVTYLFEGELLHRDSLGSLQVIQPGALNWMTAGRGIVHSERTPDALRDPETRLFGIQAWVALPESDEECEPSFVHHEAEDLPVINEAGVVVRLIAGEFMEARAPVNTSSPLVYTDVQMEPAATFTVPALFTERALYIVQGTVGIDGGTTEWSAGSLLVLEAGGPVTVRTRPDHPARLMLLGGMPMKRRFIWWNFVSSSRERIERASNDWRDGRFPGVPGEREFIPLPGSRPPPVNYP